MKIGRGRYLLLSQLAHATAAPLALSASSAKAAGALQVQCDVNMPALFAHVVSSATEADTTVQLACVLSDVSDAVQPVH